MNRLICPTCGHVGQPNPIRAGDILIEAALWFFAILPAITYLIYIASLFILPDLPGQAGNLKGPASIQANAVVVYLLLFFAFEPALIYTLWRSANAGPHCPLCDSPSVIPPDSPVGKKLAHELCTDEEMAQVREL